MEERELVVLARRGDGAAFAALVRPHLSAMLRLATVIGAPRSDAEDILQEALAKAYFALRSFDTDRPFRPWFATIVVNQTRNSARSSQRRRRLIERVAAVAPATVVGPEEQVMARSAAARARALIDTLEEHERLVVTLRQVAGLSEAETAEVLGIALGTVKSRNWRGLHHLRQRLARLTPEKNS